MNDQRFTDDCKFTPYWWDQVTARTNTEERHSKPLPKTADVVVIGSGYTGLHAALQTARGGRSTLVIDAEDSGWGCSTRNGGQISISIKGNLETLTRRYGPERAA